MENVNRQTQDLHPEPRRQRYLALLSLRPHGAPARRPDRRGGAVMVSTRPADPPAPQAYLSSPAADSTDDDFLAALYVRMWSLASGRELPRGIPPCQLPAEQLVNFWADELVTATPGRHAALDEG